MPELQGKVLNFASIIDGKTLNQAHETASLPFVQPHLALMPDAHLGMGATIGSVIPTKGAVIPAAVGVDIGCGMEALQLDLTMDDLQGLNLGPVHGAMRKAIPAGVGQGHEHLSAGQAYLDDTAEQRFSEFDQKMTQRAASQFGTLGSGNHFVELSVDQAGNIWFVLHSGSRGIGNILAKHHIDVAKKIANQYMIDLPNPDLAYLVKDTPEFEAYWMDVQWAQDYARNQRMRMVTNWMAQVREDEALPKFVVLDHISAHHNYISLEHHMGQNVYITRKGAIAAHEGVRGIIPGSMADRTFLTEGKGYPPAFKSAPHGAGRMLSRSAAKREHTVDELREKMKGIVWNDRGAEALVDEIPQAYKPITQVMEDAQDLVSITHELRQLVNYKGT